MKKNTCKPRIGVTALAFKGYNLGDELCPGKQAEMRALLSRQNVELVEVQEPVYDRASARAAGEYLRRQEVDCILMVITTFVPDHFIVDLLDSCDVPVFLWAVERELQCISLVCGPLITATLFELDKQYHLVGADINDAGAMNDLLVFARAAMLRRLLARLRVGYAGGKNDIMFSMSADDFTLKRHFGVTTITIPIQEFYDAAGSIPESAIADCWREIKESVGAVDLPPAECSMAIKYYLAARELCKIHGLEALSLNCFPHLKSQVCLAIARLNDAGIAAACEGDLYSTVVMYMLQSLQQKPAFNGDWLRMFPEDNDVLFSHCGAGAFALAESPSCIKLGVSLETKDGLAVCYPAKAEDAVTLVNMMGARETFRIAAMSGRGVKTNVEYEGTPMRVHFQEPVKTVLQHISVAGAGHHWNGAMHDCMREMELLCKFCHVRFNRIG